MKKYIPNTLTSLNLSFGIIAILVDNPLWSVGFILLAAVCDMLDGFAARKLNVVSEIGEQLDSFADLISFGFAPAFILQRIISEDFSFSAIIVISATLFAALRLARFNLMTESKPYFIGLPSPAFGMVVLGLILTTVSDFTLSIYSYTIISLVSALLMVSSIPFPAFKSFRDKTVSFIPVILAVSAFIIMLFVKFHYSLLIGMLVYMLGAIIFNLIKK